METKHQRRDMIRHPALSAMLLAVAFLCSAPAVADPRVNGADQRGFLRPGVGHTDSSIGASEPDAVAPPRAPATATSTAGSPSTS
jgi:hypothetical protein